MKTILTALACITTALALAPQAAAAECLSDEAIHESAGALGVGAQLDAGCSEFAYDFENPPYSDHGTTATTYAYAFVHTPAGTFGAGAQLLEWDGEYAGPGYAVGIDITDAQAGVFTPFTPWQNAIYLRIEQQHVEHAGGAYDSTTVAYWLPWESPSPGQVSLYDSESYCAVYAQAHGEGPGAGQSLDPAACALL